MSTPTRPIPRKFYRVAYQRFEEAEVLFEAGGRLGDTGRSHAEHRETDPSLILRELLQFRSGGWTTLRDEQRRHRENATCNPDQRGDNLSVAESLRSAKDAFPANPHPQ